MGGSSDSDLAPRSGDARDSGGGAAAPGVDGHLVALGGLRASRPQIAMVRVLEAVQGGQGPAEGVLATQHEDSQAKTVRLIAACLAAWRKGPSPCFLTQHTWEVILHAAETNKRHDMFSEPATMDLPRRAFRVFGDARYERLTAVSNRHPYNLRRSGAYAQVLGRRNVAGPSQAPTDTRPNPRQEGRQGWGRVASTHRGNFNKDRGASRQRCQRGHPVPVQGGGWSALPGATGLGAPAGVLARSGEGLPL